MSFGDGIATHCADVERRKGKFAAWRAFIYVVVVIPLTANYLLFTLLFWATDENKSKLPHFIHWQILQVWELVKRLI
jgi:hypothetical protein